MTLKSSSQGKPIAKPERRGEERMDSQLSEVKDEEEEFVVEQNW